MRDATLGLAASPWIVGLIVLAAFAVAVYTYHRTLPPVGPLRRWTLIALRTIGIGLLLFVLFEPVLSLISVRAEEPSVLVAVDNSESMTLRDGDTDRITRERNIVGEFDRSSLGDQARYVSFADSARARGASLDPDSLDASGAETRLEAPFDLLADSLRTRNIRAMVLLSDGQYNAGANPVLEAEKLGVPVYAVGLGDSVEPKDLSLQELFTNDVTYVNTQLPVEVRVKSAGYAGGTATVRLRDDNGTIATQQIPLATGTNEYTATFLYTPKREGIAKLTASVTGGDGSELTGKNNSRSTYVQVRTNKRTYVIVAGGPSPDVAFVRRMLTEDKDVTVRSFIQRSGTEFLEGPLDAAAFRDAEAVIIIGYPTTESAPDMVSRLAGIIERQHLPVLFVMGSRFDVERAKPLESILPVTFGPSRPAEMQVSVEPTKSGLSSPALRVGDPTAWNQLPPIFRSETHVTARPESDVLATARLGGLTLDEPIIVSRKLDRGRSLAILGWDIYRWQLLGEGPRAVRGQERLGVLDNVLSNSLRWLATRETGKRVRIATSKQLYNLGEHVRFMAQTYDEQYRPLNDATVSVRLSGGGTTRDLTLAPAGTGRYEAVVNDLPSGDYTFEGSGAYDGRQIGTDAGRFSVGEMPLEYLQPTMNADLLRELARRTGGRFYTAAQTASLAEDIRSRADFAPRTIESTEERPLWSSPWLLAAAIAAFAIEWLLRKRSGMM